MPLPKGTLSLQNPNAGPVQSSRKMAMLVRLPAEAYAALENAIEIQVVHDGPHPGVKIGDKFYPLQHQPETHPHELIIQARTPTRNNPPLKTHASIVHKMIPPTTQRSDASSAYARAAAAAEAPRKSTGILDSIPTTLPINGPSKAAPKKAKQPAVPTTVPKRKLPGSAAGNAAARQRASGSGGNGPLNLVAKNEGLSASTSTSRAATRPSTPVVHSNNAPATSGRASPMPPPPAPMPRSRLSSSTSRPSAEPTSREPTSAEKGEIVLAKMDPAEREALRMRMVHEVAKGAHNPRTRQDLRKSINNLDWNAFKSLLAEVAEPTPRTRSVPDNETTWGLKPRVWRDVRPYNAPPDLLSPKEANLIAEYADNQFDKQGLPHDHPAREAVRPRQPGASYAPSPNAGRSPSYHGAAGGGMSGGVSLSSKPGASGSSLPPKPPGLPPKPVGMPLPPINNSATATRQRMSPMPPPPVASARRDSPAGSVASTPKRRPEPDSEREEGEMDEDEPPRSTVVKKAGGAITKDRERERKRDDDMPDPKRRRIEGEQRARARQEDATPPPPSLSVLKKSAKRAREEEPDAVPRRAGREREREEALPPPKKKVATIKRDLSPLPLTSPTTQSQTTKKKVPRERERERDVSPPPTKKRTTSPEISRKPREREREETPNTVARRKRGREVDFTSDEDSDDDPLPRRITTSKGKGRESERESERERDREPATRKIAPIPRKSAVGAAAASGTSTPTTSVRPSLKEKDRTASNVSVKERSGPSSKESSSKPAVKHEDRDRERERDRDRDRERERPVQSKPKPKPQPPVKREPSPDLEDGEEPSSSSSSDARPAKNKFTPADLGPLPTTEDALRSRLRTAYKYYYDAHARCEDQKEAIVRALENGDYEGGENEGSGRRGGVRLLSEKAVMDMFGVYDAWRDEVVRIKAAAEGLGMSVKEEGDP